MIPYSVLITIWSDFVMVTAAKWDVCLSCVVTGYWLLVAPLVTLINLGTISLLAI